MGGETWKEVFTGTSNDKGRGTQKGTAHTENSMRLAEKSFGPRVSEERQVEYGKQRKQRLNHGTMGTSTIRGRTKAYKVPRSQNKEGEKKVRDNLKGEGELGSPPRINRQKK